MRAVLLVLLAAGVSVAEADSKVADRVVATVNDTVILQSELDARMLPLRADAQQIVDPKERERRIATLEGQLLDQMVDDELLVQAAIAAKLEVTPKEIDAALAHLRREHKLDAAGLDKALAAQGMSRATIKADLLRLRAINTVIEPKIKITDEDVHTAYDEMIRRTDNVKAVHAEHAVFATRERAQAARERIEAGEAFAVVAKDADTSRDLGWLENDKSAERRTAWDDVIFAMARGETRGPVHDSAGFHVLHAIDVKTAAIEPFAKVADALRKDLHARESAKLVHAWLQELRKAAYISRKL